MMALRSSLLEVLPKETELSAAPVATFFEHDTETVIGNSEPVIAKKNGRRAWIVRGPNAGYIWIQTAGGPRLPVTNEIMMKITAITINT